MQYWLNENLCTRALSIFGSNTSSKSVWYLNRKASYVERKIIKMLKTNDTHVYQSYYYDNHNYYCIITIHRLGRLE